MTLNLLLPCDIISKMIVGYNDHFKCITMILSEFERLYLRKLIATKEFSVNGECAHTCTHTCMHARTHARMHTCTYIHTCVGTWCMCRQ